MSDEDFYAALGVADTLDGRFDMIVAHIILVLRRLKGDKVLAQALFDAFFADLDQSLREMGVGDLTVPKKVKAMSQAFYGRIDAYGPALDAGDTDALAIAVEHNISRSEAEAPRPEAKRLAAYLMVQRDALTAQKDDALHAGNIVFAPVELS